MEREIPARIVVRINTEYRIQDTEYRIQDTEYRIQDTEYRIQDTEYRIWEYINIDYFGLLNTYYLDLYKFKSKQVNIFSATEASLVFCILYPVSCILYPVFSILRVQNHRRISSTHNNDFSILRFC